MRLVFGTALLIMVSAAPLSAQALNAQNLDGQDQNSRGRWSVSTSLTFPLVRIYQVYLNYRIDDRNEVSIDPAFQNYRHESFTANAYTLIVGYRRYLTDGLSVEAELNPAYNRMYSNVTESYHPGWELWAEAKVGYTVDFADISAWEALIPSSSSGSGTRSPCPGHPGGPSTKYS